MSASDVAALVKQAVDIVDVVGQVVPLRRVGNRYIGLCPFHAEKTGSFHVDGESQFFHCFGCGAGGDVLTFVMRYQNLPFADALKYLADRYNIALPERDRGESGAARASREEHDRLHHVLKAASDFFYDQLHRSAAGKAAREYVAKRGLPEKTLEAQRLGFAPDRWDGLLQYLKGMGANPDLGVQAGLLVQADGGRCYDRFRNRLIFPIADDQGRIVAFGGRSLDGSEPKYLNSPETPVYHKGRMLYQYATARKACRDVRQVVVVEGYMDLLAFHGRDFFRVAATLGTALTPQQVRLLARIADEVILLYDADPAGEKAMVRAAPLFLQERLAVTCLQLPDGMDPDDFLRAKGLEEFEKLMQQRRSLAAHITGKTLDQWDGTNGGKTKVLTELQSLYASMNQPVLRMECLRLIADRLSLPEKVIDQQLRRGSRMSGKAAPHFTAAPIPECSQTQSPEESILRIMVKHPSMIEEVKASGGVEFFNPPQLKAIAEALVQSPHPPREAFDASAVYAMLPEQELKELFTRLLMEWDSYGEASEAQLYLQDRLGALLQREEKKKPPSLREALRAAELEGDAEKALRLLKQIRDLHSSKKTKERQENV